ncbi:type VII secretion-associated protein [Labedaea rhizosphaerae]|uniref:Chaperone protein HscA n=1 Tax=Labedaea rhizosphaerae TaxID=598644 RepID=A0A4V3D0J0_LABRH|nr:type VII secretion-associated protein [Labedaea rhizosphaerae]TDQ05775.1 chaperone protein HscA [Labedaea rhizosphaerae]
MTVRVAVDFGTSSTCVVVSVDGREPQVVVVDGQPLMSSALYLAPDGTLFVGQEAERHAALDPSRYEPHPKRRIDDGQLLLGNSVLPVTAAIRAVIGRAVAEARRVAGGAPVDQLVVTHPADWGGVRATVLRSAASTFARSVILVPEPVAAAVFHAASFARQEQGKDTLAVIDLGGGTVDVSVVRRVPQVGQRIAPGYQVLATRGDPNFGGADIDQLIVEHIGRQVSGTDQEAWDHLVAGRDLPDRRRRRVLWQDVRNAKETLSRHTYTDIPLPSPFPDVHLTRADLENLIAKQIAGTVDLANAAIAQAGLNTAELAGIFLVGGSSRIPMVARLVHQRCHLIPTILDQPETVVARGALRATAVIDPARTGRLPAEVAEGRQDPAVSGPHPVSTPVPTGPQPIQPHPFADPAYTGLPPERPRRKRAPAVLLTGALLVIVALVITLVLVTKGGDGQASPTSTTPDPALNRREIAQYDYRFAMPPDWKQTGGDPQRREVEIQPADAVGGPDLVYVEEAVLTYDSTADRIRAVTKLRADFDAAGAKFTDFDPDAHYAGKDVVHYRQGVTTNTGAATIDWYVVFQKTVQVSIGCRRDDAGGGTPRRADAACEMVVGTLTVVG